ncbi:3-methyl-2-oxobutanoate hydroxymethyltransferase [candidate division KSB1 bacterium]|nr:3-methyl-2-oxobutanoate hydroxymethyltransferase [candidate division KSB1 bacterium]
MSVDNKVSILDLHKKRDSGVPITMITAYDYPGAILAEEAGVDTILVGDSLAMTVLGHPNTISVTMEEMLHHCRAVSRGANRALLIADMPFLSYHVSIEEAIRNAGRFLKEAHMDAVKLEGSGAMAKTAAAINTAGIPVMGHIGLTPQTAAKSGGYKVRGKTAEHALLLLQDALALEDAGCFAIVLEAIPAPVAEQITQKLSIPTIGIGAGAGTDGQVLVFHDILGLFDQFVPKFVKQYANLRQPVIDAIKAYCEEIRTGKFPQAEHSFKMDKSELDKFLDYLEK